MRGDDNRPLRLPPQNGLVGRFLEFTKYLPSAEVFRLATAIHAVGATGKRHVWSIIDSMQNYPNVFMFLIGEPNTGKTVAMTKMTSLVPKANYPFWIGPKLASKQGLIDELNKPECQTTCFDKGNNIVDGRYMALYWPEIASAMAEHDPNVTGFLTEMWDCPDVFDEGLRVAKGKRVDFPGASLLVGAAIDKLNKVFPPTTWGDGFMSRAIMVHSNDIPPPRDRFARRPLDEVLQGEIIELLKKLGTFAGEMEWSLEARDLYNDWSNDNNDGPIHHLLKFYNSRRPRHMSKFIMIAALNELRMDVVAEDFHTAMGWMKLFEANMDAIFLNMTSHPDALILDEIGHQVAEWHYARDRQEVPIVVVQRMLSNIAPHFQIKSFLQAAEDSGRINRVAGTQGENTLYTPADRFRRL